MAPPPPPLSRRATARSNAPLVGALLAFTGLMAAVPVLLHRRQMRLQEGVPMWASDKPLNATQVRRGAYLNTSSIDVGPDPDWDHGKGLYKGKLPAIMDESRRY
uniref:Uncharacterized protein n=1 Tax=Calcidiscus leptoporus TaxID=127549 RepID=A0A7S0P0K3_9EUKA|mmetsp:Transcript_47762/g.110694  ORF Transcript_47762/g.110694 Transcript_47762/m.110694 type:complete len:104 (+) Transcript_47762:95-406(+)|eukprot:CAMPEP_0119358342 /NCGR_PEP_ID=MMETSP1334-20130426/6567_1 /TAXON_ID=127549 /ORGANISM="Calcidiscus leptoporus, Strain RCC1130" /LENGTH=103 /DNA_ID=CAMNT_0007372805 /DNA_START=71 /DNA_END=382 /DNA_ORIENTATION=+